MTWLGTDALDNEPREYLPKQHKYDKYNEAVQQLQSISTMLYGGYYEPKSQRDYDLANLIEELVAKYKTKYNT